MPIGGRHGEWMEAAVSERLIFVPRDPVAQYDVARNRQRETKDKIHEQIKYRFRGSGLVKGNVAVIDRGQAETPWRRVDRSNVCDFIDVSPTFCHSVKTLIEGSSMETGR